MNKISLNIVLASLIHNDKILLIKRNKQPFKDLWGMPGGKVEFSEHIDKAIIREILEETGLIIKPRRLLAVLSEIFVDKNKKDKPLYHSIIFLYDTLIENPLSLKKSSEGDLKWFDLKNLPKGQIIPSDFQMIKQIILKHTNKTNFYKICIIIDRNKFILDYFKV